MDDASQPSKEPGNTESFPEDLGHPRGTLVVVALFGGLFALGWLLIYLWVFLQRGGLHP
jgi:hypothetical protein